MSALRWDLFSILNGFMFIQHYFIYRSRSRKLYGSGGSGSLGSGSAILNITDRCDRGCFLFRCRLCGKACLFTIDSVHDHVSYSHRMNWSAYKQQYLSPGGEDRRTSPDAVAEEEDSIFLIDLPLQVSLHKS